MLYVGNPSVALFLCAPAAWYLAFGEEWVTAGLPLGGCSLYFTKIQEPAADPWLLESCFAPESDQTPLCIS